MRAIRRLVTIGSVVVALLFTGAREGVAAESTTWETYQDQNCGIEFKYPTSYQLSDSPATDYCALWIRVGEAFELVVEEMDNFYRQAMVDSRMEISPRHFAIFRAALHCAADGPDSSTYCTDAMKEVAFKTVQGLNAYEFYLTEVHESYPDEGATTIEKRTKGPILALDISDGETIRVLLATPTEQEEKSDSHLATLKAMVDTVRISGKARRPTPQIIELERLTPCPPKCGVYAPPPQR